MLAGVRNVAWGAAMAMAGIVALMLAGCLWIIILFPSDARYIFFGPWFAFDGPIQIYAQHAQILLGLAVVMWLIAHVIRRASRSISARRS